MNKLDAVRPSTSPHKLSRNRPLCSWTGWLVDMDTLQNISNKYMPESFLSIYPRFHANRTNAWFTGFAIVCDGMWFKLDHNGSKMAKRLIMNSFYASGYWAVVQGIRDKDTIIVKGIKELPKPQSTPQSIDDRGDDKRWWRASLK
jgi:hypothetical protein